MHLTLHQNLQARPPALKDNTSWTSQLLWISIFSSVKEGAFFFFLLQCDVKNIKGNNAWEATNHSF